jgi:HD-like signal output (HDOD) protein/CheY-like chemotaxis protein
MRVLFVDDEARVLEAIERVLFELDTPWETSFLTSGELALAEFSRAPYDVVISDLRMPGMDGVGLLTRIAEKYPRTVRIVLSGHSDEEAALKMVHVAHQFLAKPCAAETLHQVIARTLQLTQLLPDRKLQTLAGQVGTLPSAAHFHRELSALGERDDAGPAAAAMARLIKQDPGMTAKLLQIASSAFFNSSASVADVEAAIMRLGFRTLRNLTHTLGSAAPTRPTALPTVTAVEALQARALCIAQLASSMARLPEDASSAYIAGLLCDVGQLVLVSAAPERLYVSQAEAARRGVPAHVAERATWGATHAEIGAYLLGLWGLPFQIVEAVANHHAPERGAGEHVGLPQLVWLAACIVEGEQPASELLSRFGAEDLYATQRRQFQKGHA